MLGEIAITNPEVVRVSDTSPLAIERPAPYLWRYREQMSNGEIDTLLLPDPGDTFPEDVIGAANGETTIVWWDDD